VKQQVQFFSKVNHDHGSWEGGIRAGRPCQASPDNCFSGESRDRTSGAREAGQRNRFVFGRAATTARQPAVRFFALVARGAVVAGRHDDDVVLAARHVRLELEAVDRAVPAHVALERVAEAMATGVYGEHHVIEKKATAVRAQVSLQLLDVAFAVAGREQAETGTRGVARLQTTQGRNASGVVVFAPHGGHIFALDRFHGRGRRGTVGVGQVVARGVCVPAGLRRRLHVVQVVVDLSKEEQG